MDFLDVLPCRSEAIGDLLLRYDALERPDFADVVFGEFGLRMMLATIVGAMPQPVILILLWSSPRQMTLGDAAVIAAAAGVCRFIVWMRRRSVGLKADKARHGMGSVAFTQLPVPVSFVRKRPDQAVVTVIRQDDFEEVAPSIATACSAAERVTMLAPAVVVPRTPAASLSEHRLAAVGN